MDPADMARRRQMKVVIRRLDEPEDHSDVLALSPSQRLAMVEELTRNAFAFAPHGPPLPRHLWPVVIRNF